MESEKGAIKVNEASIIDLKAELIKKEKEFQKEQKNITGYEDSCYVSNSGSKTFGKILQLSGRRKQKNKIEANVPESCPVEEYREEEAERLAKSKAVLEAKAKLYEQIIKGEAEDPEDDNGESKYLVEFYRKTEPQGCSSREEVRDTKESRESDGTRTLMSADMRREQLRQKWEKEQEELMNSPDLSLHYANVQFDEIREHGVGFYQFSKNQQERQSQMEKLQRLREQTEKQRGKREQVKERRKAALEARLAKVRQRKYGSDIPSTGSDGLGDEGHEETPSKDQSVESTDSQLPVSVSSTATNQSRLTEEPLGLLESSPKKPRRGHIIGSEAWINLQRDERNPMFAPPTAYSETNTRIRRGNARHEKYKSNIRPPQPTSIPTEEHLQRQQRSGETKGKRNFVNSDISINTFLQSCRNPDDTSDSR